MAGLLDALFSGGSSGGLLDFLQNNARNQQFPGLMQQDTAQYGQQPMGAMAQSPIMPQQSAQPSPMQANAQIPQQPPPIIPAQPPQQSSPQMAAPTQGQPQQSAVQPFQMQRPNPWMGDPDSFLNRLAGTDPATQGLAQQQFNQRAIISGLKAHGVADADIMAGLANPKYLDKLLENNVKEKQDYRPATDAERKSAGVVVGQPLYIETNTNKPMFGPSQTNVSTTINGEKEQDKTLGKGYGERQMEISKAGYNAPAALGNINLMEKLIQKPDFYSGSGGSSVTALKRLSASLGLSPPEGASANELFEKVSKKTVLDAAGGSLGTGFSNADREYLNSTVANIENTPEGNKQILSAAREVQNRNLEIAKQAREYAKAHEGRIDAGFEDQIAKYAEAHPLFENVSNAAAGPDMSKAQKAPDGNTYVPDPARPGKYLKVNQ